MSDPRKVLSDPEIQILFLRRKVDKLSRQRDTLCAETARLQDERDAAREALERGIRRVFAAERRRGGLLSADEMASLLRAVPGEQP